MPNKAERDAWKEKLVNDAEQKILELTDSDKFKDYLNTLSKFHGYSQRNVDFIFAQDPSGRFVRTFALNIYRQFVGRDLKLKIEL